MVSATWLFFLSQRVGACACEEGKFCGPCEMKLWPWAACRLRVLSTCMYFFTVFREIWARGEVSKWSSAGIFIGQVLGSEVVFYGRDARTVEGLVSSYLSKPGDELQGVALWPAAAHFVGALSTCQTQCVLLSFGSELKQKHAMLLSRNDHGDLMQKR